MRQASQRVDRPLHSLVPFLLADFLASLIADHLVIVLPFSKRKMSDLEMRRERAVHEEGRSEPRSQRDHHLEPFAFNRAVALHVSVVDHASRFAESFLERAREVKSVQLLGAKI